MTATTAAYPRGRLCWPASVVATAAAGLLVDVLGGIADVLAAGSLLPGLKVLEDRFGVVIEPCSVCVTHGSELGNVRVSRLFPHGRVSSVRQACKW